MSSTQGLSQAQFYTLREEIEGIYTAVETTEKALRFLRENLSEEAAGAAELAVLDLSLGALRCTMAREDESYAKLTDCLGKEDKR